MQLVPTILGYFASSYGHSKHLRHCGEESAARSFSMAAATFVGPTATVRTRWSRRGRSRRSSGAITQALTGLSGGLWSCIAQVVRLSGAVELACYWWCVLWAFTDQAPVAAIAVFTAPTP